MRILVIGGSGFLGTRTVRALSAVPGAEITVGSRTPGRSAPGRRPADVPHTTIDLTIPSTLPQMKAYDVVVNTSDTVAASPVRAVEYALDNGVRFVEAGAHPPTMEALLRSTRGPAADPRGWTGTVVLGMGLFPGLSNLLARELWRWTGGSPSLDVVVRLNPLAGAGAGIVELMVHALREETVRYREGRRVVEPPTRPGVPLFTGRDTVSTVGVGLCEAHMLRISLGVPSVATYIATVPKLPDWMTRALQRWIPSGPGADKLFTPLIRRYLLLLRTRLFRRNVEFVEINVVTGAGEQVALRTDDGAAATAYALAAAVAAMADSAPGAGVYLPDELFSLGDIVHRALALSEGAFRLSIHSTLVDGESAHPG